MLTLCSVFQTLSNTTHGSWFRRSGHHNRRHHHSARSSWRTCRSHTGTRWARTAAGSLKIHTDSEQRLNVMMLIVSVVVMTFQSPGRLQAASALRPNPHRTWTRRARKFECFSFDVACVQCGHPHSHQQVPFACVTLHVASCILCGLGPSQGLMFCFAMKRFHSAHKVGEA